MKTKLLSALFLLICTAAFAQPSTRLRITQLRGPSDTSQIYLIQADGDTITWERQQRDTLYSITNVPDTTSLSPNQGDLFLTTAKDTLGIYRGPDGWALFPNGADGNGIIDALPAGNVTISAGGNNLVILSTGFFYISSPDGSHISFQDGDVLLNSQQAGTDYTQVQLGERVAISGRYGGGSTYEYELASSAPSTTLGDTTVHVWIGDGASAVPGFIDYAAGGGGGSGETNTASNVGDGTGVFYQKSGVDLEFRSLKTGYGVDISNTDTTVTHAADTLEMATLYALEDSINTVQAVQDTLPTASGTSGRIARFSATRRLVDSWLNQSGSRLSLDTLRVLQLRGGPVASRPPGSKGDHWFDVDAGRPQWYDGTTWNYYSPWTRKSYGIYNGNSVTIGEETSRSSVDRFYVRTIEGERIRFVGDTYRFEGLRSTSAAGTALFVVLGDNDGGVSRPHFLIADADASAATRLSYGVSTEVATPFFYMGSQSTTMPFQFESPTISLGGSYDINYSVNFGGTKPIRIPRRATPPSAMATGAMYYHSTKNEYTGYKGSSNVFFVTMDTLRTKVTANNYVFNIDQTLTGLNRKVMAYNSTSGEMEIQSQSFGEAYIQRSDPDTVTVTTAGTPVVLTDVSTGITSNFTVSTAGRLTYTGASTTNFRITWTATVSCNANNENIIGTINDNAGTYTRISWQEEDTASGDNHSVAANGTISLDQNDWIEPQIDTESNGTQVFIRSMSLIIEEIR